MTSFALGPAFADQPDASLYSVNKQEPDDYAEKRVKGNVLYALESEARLTDLSADLGDSYWNRTSESSHTISRTTDKMDVEQLLLPIRDRVFHQNQTQVKRTLTPTAEWEGYVESIGEDDFFVRMTNVRSNSSLPDDHAVFSKDDISEHERHFLKEGAIVRWVIGRERLPTGQVRKVSELYFRRLPAHTEADYQRAFDKANALLTEVIWDDDSQT